MKISLRHSLPLVATGGVFLGSMLSGFTQEHHSPSADTPGSLDSGSAKLVIAPAEPEPTHAHNHSRPDGYAPINIMPDHAHPAGEWMLSFRYMYMNMDGMRNHANDVSSQEVFNAGYVITPERMSSSMFMGGVMYAPTDWLTISLMGSYSYKVMQHRIAPAAKPLIALNGGGDQFTTRSGGFGDLKLTPIFRLFDKDGMHLIFGGGMSIPTGAIDNTDTVPGPGGRKNRLLPPAMQIGSGTFDFVPSLTWTQQFPIWSYGAQAKSTIRIGKNTRGYRLGNEVGLDAWAALNISRWFSLNTTLAYQWTGELEGTPSGLLQAPPFAPGLRTNPTVYGDNYGGHQLDLGVGFNILLPANFFGDNRIAVEVQFPVWQNLNGFQLEQDLMVTAGWQFTF